MSKNSIMLPPDLSRDQLEALLKRHWTRPSTAQLIPAPSPDQLDGMVKATFDVLMTRQFRVGPLPEPRIHEEILIRIRHFISQGKPIKISLGYAPLKNQNAVNYCRADWAEFFALGHLIAWHNKVQKTYPPGLQIQIVFDDAALRMANGTSTKLMNSYMNSVEELIKKMRYGSIFLKPIAQSLFAWLFHFGAYQVAKYRVWLWERQPGSREQIEKMDQAAARNLSIKPGLSHVQQTKAIRKASHLYRVHWEALQWIGFTRSRKRLIAMYLDGTQHHIKQPVALHLTTLDKGQVTQPWQGEGILASNGHGKWEPGVMTASRRQKWHSFTINQLNVIDMPGFDQISLTKATPTVVPEDHPLKCVTLPPLLAS